MANLVVLSSLQGLCGSMKFMSTGEFATQLVKELVASRSYTLWQEPDFREASGFSKITNKEQDRIFNELEVTALVYILFFLEDKANNKGLTKFQAVYANLAELITGAFLDMMASMNISQVYLKLWAKLIDKRTKEYREDMGFILKRSEKWDVFEGEEKIVRSAWGRIATLSVGAVRHIRRSEKELKDDDVLWKIMRSFLINLEVSLVQTFRDTDPRELSVLN